MAEEKKSKSKKKVSEIIINVIIWIIVVFSALVITLVLISLNSNDKVPELFGKTLITIDSASMTPTYNVGDMVLMTRLSDEEKDQLKVGDIITYHAPIDINQDGQIGDLNTHRIIAIEEDGTILTKGDYEFNVQDKYTITKNDILGICTEDGKISGVGGVMKFLQTSMGFFVCIILPLILFFLYELYNVISMVVTEKAKRAPVDKETEEEIKRKAIEEFLRQQEAAAAEKKEE